MGYSILKRVIYVLLVLICISFLSFTLANIASVDPAEAYARRINKSASEETIQQLRKEMGFDKPVFFQYLSWLNRVTHLDFGNSYITHKPVLNEMLEVLPVTIIIALCSAILILLCAVPLGLISAWKSGFLSDKIIAFFSFFMVSTPGYLIGLMCVMIFGMKLKLFPVIGHGNPVSLIFAAFVLALPMIGSLTRLMRSMILEEQDKDYILYAKARGIPQKGILLRHLLRNIAPACVTLFGQNIGYLIAGTSIAETVFAARGLGQYAINAALNRDFPAINGYIVLMAFFFVSFNIISEVIGILLNPKLNRENLV